MNLPTPSREEEIFAELVALPRPQRAAYLEKVCRGDSALRQRIEGLLQSHDEAGGFLQSPATDMARVVAQHAPPQESAGQAIGRYKLLQKIGEGGCGVVYMAEQQEPVRRRVALKVIKLGMDTKEVIARFEAERQALALMDHLNIARVFDAGATEAGRPFFVMELVRGVPITKYCDEQNLPTKARLELFTQVCHAVQHAHQKGIIHRDLKPSNILVTLHDGAPVPKVIDFGIAKATQGRLTDSTLFTAFEQFIGTPAYMSPEQAELSGLDIDTRSDIYSLGVLLYELLAGRPPFDPKSLVSAGLDEIRRIIREVEPPRPSTRLSTLTDLERATIAKLRGILPAQLSTLLRGDLDWIVMRCLEKDRTRRYETANGLALDVLRHLHDEPVVARPTSQLYRLRKLVRRNKLAVGATAAVVIALVTGLAVATWRYQREKSARTAEAAARALAEQRRTEVESINRFLVTDMLGSANPEIAQGREISVKEVLANAATRIDGAFAGNPLLEASIRHTLGVTYRSVGEFPLAENHIRAALEKRRNLLGPHHTFTLESQSILGSLRGLQGKYLDGIEILRPTLELQRRLLGPADAETLKTTNYLCQILVWYQKYPEAERLARPAWEIANARLAPEDRMRLSVLHSLTKTLWPQDSVEKLAECQSLFGQLIALQERIGGPDHPDTLSLMYDHAGLLTRLGRPAEAEPILRSVVETGARVWGPRHTSLTLAQQSLGRCLSSLDRPEEGLKMLRTAVESSRQGGGVRAGHTMSNLVELFRELLAEARWTEAADLMREWTPLVQQVRTIDDEWYSACSLMWGIALTNKGNFAEAETLLREAASIREKHMADDQRRFSPQAQLGAALLGQRRFSEAEACLISAYDGLLPTAAKSSSDRPSLIPATLLRLVLLYTEWDKPESAGKWKKTLDEYQRQSVALVTERRFAEAASRLGSTYVGLVAAVANLPASQKTTGLRPVLEALTKLYTDWEKPALAARWRTKLDRLVADEVKAAGGESTRSNRKIL